MAIRQWIDWSGSEELTIKGHEGTSGLMKCIC